MKQDIKHIIDRLCIPVIILCLFSIDSINAQIIYSKVDSLVCVEYLNSLERYKEKPINEIFTQTAKYFLGKPYIASTLDRSETEKLTINLREFDCTTLVESCIALSETVVSNNPTFESFCNKLKRIRYRNDTIEDYASRLHYVLDWMFENRDILKDISPELGGEPESKLINFMSTHVSAYPQLTKNNILQKKIKKVESSLNKRGGYYVINKQSIHKIENKIQNGDIIVFSTSIAGLDFSHIGIAYRNEKHLTFIHASSAKGKVIVEPLSLSDYCKKSSKCNGIVVLRLYNKTYL